MVADHGLGGVLLEGFQQGRQILDGRVPGRPGVPDDVGESDGHGRRGQLTGRCQQDALVRRGEVPPPDVGLQVLDDRQQRVGQIRGVGRPARSARDQHVDTGDDLSGLPFR